MASGDVQTRRGATAKGSPNDKLTLAEVCGELRISKSTFYDWRAKGRAPRCTKLPNGDLRIRRVDFDAWYEDLEGVA